MKVSLLVCDICKNRSRPVKTYRVTCEGRAASTDLCAEHGTIFEQVFEKVEVPRGRDGRQRVTSLAEIEAKKAERR